VNIWTFLLPLPQSRSKRLRLLRTVFTSSIALEILQKFELDVIKCQRDLVEELVGHSNKTVLRMLRELVEVGVLVERIVDGYNKSGRKTRLKCYQLTPLGRWIKLMVTEPYVMPREVLRNEVLDLYGLLGESIAKIFTELSIEPEVVFGRMLVRTLKSLVNSSPRYSRPDVVAVGSTAFDIHVEVSAGLMNPILAEPGGSGANVAWCLAALGTKTKFFSSVGADFEGLLSASSLVRVGVDISSLEIHEGKATNNVLIIHRGGCEEMIKIVGRGTAISPTLSPPKLRDISAEVYYAGDTYVENAAVIAEEASEKNKLFVYSPTAEIVSYSPSVVANILSRYRPLLIVDEDTTRRISTTIGFTPRELAELGVEVVVTMGSRGLILHSKNHSLKFSPPQVKRIDSTGAGDVLTAYTIAELLRGEELEQALRWGVAGGALSVTKLGARTLPSPEDVESYLDQVRVEKL